MLRGSANVATFSSESCSWLSCVPSTIPFITVAVLLSLVVSVVVIPSFSARLLRADRVRPQGAGLGAWLRGRVLRRVEGLVASRLKSLVVVVGAVGAALTVAVCVPGGAMVYFILLYLFRFDELARLKAMFLSYLNER